ncbi:sugar ABC transporter ATP-binding protein [Bacillus sp. CH30_1T]|uniref:sugar ABC transporter ATP-binding protein n=1 Tax=Bacillus sp. CH30_1T TaxID=2604836 RepID=UPI0011EC3A16|nr:sugar ABC transporter ATP-binding protein [Bacillus sp. CH30_1T]KAA0565955.1 sugar ABC transporter ATP-binding protein [Bacillus sp. CH30_1T]
MTSPLLEMININKTFSGVKALKTASFDVKEGEVHALLGANGAGKSTLMKILSGAYVQDSGDIILHSGKRDYQSPKEAKEHGIHCVYQEVDTAVVPELSVAENIVLDRFSQKGSFFITKKSLKKEALEALRRIGAEAIPLGQPASRLSLAEKQLVLIARSLLQKAKILILDEPTAPLSSSETEKLFRVIEDLKKERVGIIFISHRLPEVFELSDRITVMRDGETIGTYETHHTTSQKIIEAMLGGTYREEFQKRRLPIGETLYEVKGLSDGQKVKDIHLSVKASEVVGVVGLVGAGKTELAKALFGASQVESGDHFLKGKKLRIHSPRDAVQNGLALVPEERRKEGLFIHESVQHNLSFPSLRKVSNWLWINGREERELAREKIRSLGIRTAHEGIQANFLSGGNQQKVSIGKWLSDEASVFLFDEPTKGVDVGAKKEIFSLIQSLAEKEKGILYFSCEIQEILAISDRILVMYDGRIAKELTKEEATQELILFYASGGI